MRFPKLRYSSKYFAQIYRDEYLRGTPTLRPENSVNIWSLLWPSRRLTVCTEQASIYIPKKHRSEFIGNYLFNKHCSSFKKLEIFLKHTDKQKFPRNTNFNQSSLFSKKTIPFARGTERDTGFQFLRDFRNCYWPAQNHKLAETNHIAVSGFE